MIYSFAGYSSDKKKNSIKNISKPNKLKSKKKQTNKNDSFFG